MENYQELGLSLNESKVYETLIEWGMLSANELSIKSSVPYGKVYIILNKLVNKGLVRIIPEKTKKFAASDPKFLIKFINEKLEKLEKTKEKANQLKKLYEIKEKNPVSVGYGRSSFYKMERELPFPKKSVFNIKYTAEIRPEWEREHQEYSKKGVEIKELVRDNKEIETNIKKWLKSNKNIKKIKNEGVAISIIDDKEILISLINSNIVLAIKDAAFVKLMHRLCLETYKNAEDIK